MSSANRLRDHARMVAIAKLQQLAARIALARERDEEHKALAQLSRADDERQRTLHLWQDRLGAPVLDPILVTQLSRRLAQNETVYDEAQGASTAAADRVRERQAHLCEAEGRQAALERALARALRRLHRKREDRAADERASAAWGGFPS